MFQVQPFSQRDPRWKDNLLGTDNSSTIGSYGCLLTCLTMVADAFGASETPATLNNKMKAAGGFPGRHDDPRRPAECGRQSALQRLSALSRIHLRR